MTAPVAAPSMPHSRDNEEAVIGCVFINPDVYIDLTEIITSADFFIHRNRWIWQCFESLHSRNEAIDILTASHELERMGKLEEAGGSAYLTSTMLALQTSLNAESYARAVKDMAKRREGIRIANEIATAAYKNEMFDLSSFAAHMISGQSISTRRIGSDILGEIYSDLYEPQMPLTYGVVELDNRLGGMFRTELSILAGDQGTGKSALMIWTARANALMGLRVLGVSLEMKAKSWFMRMACGDLGVNWNQVRANRVTDTVRNAVWEKAQELQELYKDNLVVYEDPMSLQSIKAAAIREAADIVFIDHVGLIAGMREAKSGTDKIDQLNGITRFLRQEIAKPLGCHVSLLWQLNRSAFKENRKPTKHDLYMAGTQDPDSILLLYRPDLYDEDAQNNPPTDKPVDLDVIVGKARNDFTGIVPIKYNLKKQSFSGLARAENK